mmetsp:Transcript_28931/g.76333  ORF Transcript_28931/g.76333 Transcript_28931/m.76333 type:complete len:153 (-) Transcript_28931:175-633(-)
MPKFYCEYCDLYLTHSGVAGRRQHLTGRRHINNKIEYYQTLIKDKGLTPPIYPPPPGMMLPLMLPTPTLRPGLGSPGLCGMGSMGGLMLPGMCGGARPNMLLGMPGIPGLPSLPGMQGYGGLGGLGGLGGMQGIAMPKQPGQLALPGMTAGR